MLKRTIIFSLALLTMIAPRALAHNGELDDWSDLWSSWAWEPIPLACLALSAILYMIGIVNLWSSSAIGHGIKKWEAACFALGWLSLFIALISPLHPLGSVLFSAHMTQHEILMLVSAPLLVLGKPMIVCLRALPSSGASALARFSNTPIWTRFWHFITNTFVAFLISSITLWVWHLPALFNAALTNEWVHAAQHTCFLFSSLLFWWAIIHVKDRTMGYGPALLYMFATALHNTLLGVLLTFASHVWYAQYLDTAPNFGFTPLEDQQLGGLIMWIPAGIVYIIAALWLMAQWLKEAELRVQKQSDLSPHATRARVQVNRNCPAWGVES